MTVVIDAIYMTDKEADQLREVLKPHPELYRKVLGYSKEIHGKKKKSS